MSKRTPLDRIPEPPPKSPQSKAAPPASMTKLLPMKAPTPALSGKGEPVWRIAWPKLAPARLDQPQPGLAIIEAVELIASDLAAKLPADLYLGRLLLRHDGLIREGEGIEAQKELEAIDHYIAEQAHGYARLRRKESRQAGFSISKAVAFCAVRYLPGRAARVIVNFSLTGRGHEARRSVEIEIKLP